MQTYKDLVVWQKSVELTKAIYELTEKYPASEMYGLTSQMRRSAVSIPSNIAEGYRRSGKKEFKQFLSIAYGSGAELETQLEISKALPLGKNLTFDQAENLLSEVMRMLNKFISTLRTTN